MRSLKDILNFNEINVICVSLKKEHKFKRILLGKLETERRFL